MSRDLRPVREVPPWLWAAGAACLAAQLGWQAILGPARTEADALPPPPSSAAVRLAAFGESAAAARLGMLYLQPFDLRGLDYARLQGWLAALLEVDSRSQYPLFAAARIYAEHPDPARVVSMLDFIHAQFLRDPERRWPWLAHAALLAKHRLKDLPRARRYAAAVTQHATTGEVPLWARQMEIFILEDMNELEAAKVMLGGLLASGRVTDAAEARFLQERLEALEARIRGR